MFTSISAFIITLGAVVAALVGIASAIYPIWKYFIYPKLVQPVTNKWHETSESVALIRKVYATLGPNGGSSLYDRIASMDRKISITDVRTIGLNSAHGYGEWLSGPDGRCARVNDIIIRKTGRPETDFLNNNWLHTIHEDDRENVQMEWEECVRQQRLFSMDYRILTYDYKPIEVSVVGRPIYNSMHEFIGHIGNINFNNEKGPD